MTRCLADIAAPAGLVDMLDLLTQLANWNMNGPDADIAPPDNVVDVLDLLSLLAGWDPCS